MQPFCGCRHTRHVSIAEDGDPGGTGVHHLRNRNAVAAPSQEVKSLSRGNGSKSSAMDHRRDDSWLPDANRFAVADTHGTFPRVAEVRHQQCGKKCGKNGGRIQEVKSLSRGNGSKSSAIDHRRDDSWLPDATALRLQIHTLRSPG
jgi:hypothetical protein